MIEPIEILLGGLLPAILAAVVLAVVWKLTRHAGAAWSAGLVLGCVAGLWALDAHAVGISIAVAKSFNPHEARDWLPAAMLLSMVPSALSHPNSKSCQSTSAITGAGKSGRVIAWLLGIVLCVLLPWRLLAGSAYLPNVSSVEASFEGMGGWSTFETVAWLGGIGAMLFVFWFVAAWEGKSNSWRLRGLLAIAVVLGAAVTLAMSGSITYGQLLGVLTAALAGSWVVAIMLRLESGPEAAAGPLVAIFGGALVLAHFYSELKLLHAGLLLLAMAVAIGGWLPEAKLSCRGQLALRSLLCLIPLAIVVTLAAMDFSATQAEVQRNPYLGL